MGNLKRWKKHSKSHSSYLKWDEVGQEVEGLWLGTEDKGGDLPGLNGVILQANGQEVRVSMTTALTEELADLPEQTELRIVYVGQRPHKKKGFNPTKLFDVYVAETDPVPGQVAAKKAADDDVPF